MRRILAALAESIAALSSGLFSGASLYINLVEHPARMQAGTRVALAEFAPSYKRATVTQVSLATAGFLSAGRLEIQVRREVAARRRVAGVGRAFHGPGDTADEQEVA